MAEKKPVGKKIAVASCLQFKTGILPHQVKISFIESSDIWLF